MAEEPLDTVAVPYMADVTPPVPADAPRQGGRYGQETAGEERQHPEARPYRAVFTSTPGKFELGENRRFKQVVFRFADRPDQDVIDQLKAAGFKYRSDEKAWTAPATAASRELARTMADQLHVRAGGTAEQLGR